MGKLMRGITRCDSMRAISRAGSISIASEPGILSRRRSWSSFGKSCAVEKREAHCKSSAVGFTHLSIAFHASRGLRSQLICHPLSPATSQTPVSFNPLDLADISIYLPTETPGVLRGYTRPPPHTGLSAVLRRHLWLLHCLIQFLPSVLCDHRSGVCFSLRCFQTFIPFKQQRFSFRKAFLDRQAFTKGALGKCSKEM